MDALDAMAKVLFPQSFDMSYGITWYMRYIFFCMVTYNKVIIKLPRFHAKSTIITFAYVMYCILTQKKKFILVVSSTGGQAVKFLNRISAHLQSRKVQQYFGKLNSDANITVETVR